MPSDDAPDPLQVDTGRVTIDDPLLRRLRAYLVDPATPRDIAASALDVAARLTRREPAVAAMIAERVRADRAQWRHEVHLPMATPTRTIDAEAAARAVARSACASLAATAMLELEERGGARPAWARALVELSGAEGRDYLARMRGRPRWSALSPTPAAEGLDALVSPIADIRRPALEALAAAPQPARLRALLLATELDRHVIRDVLREPWTRVDATAWYPLLVGHGPAADLDLRLVGDPSVPRYSSPRSLAIAQHFLVHVRAEHLLVDLVEAGAARAPMEVEQELTPAMRELESDGTAAFAARHIPDPRLTADELAALDAAEAQLAASSARWWGA